MSFNTVFLLFLVVLILAFFVWVAVQSSSGRMTPPKNEEKQEWQKDKNSP